MCVSTCHVENCLSLFYYCGVDLSDFRETSQFRKELPCFLITTRAEGMEDIESWIVINCTTVESVLELVSTFRLACSSQRQETNNNNNRIYIAPFPKDTKR